jgi:hypothetical protein
MAAPERFAETSDSSLASRAPSIHGTSQDVRLESAKWGKADLDQVAVAIAIYEYVALAKRYRPGYLAAMLLRPEYLSQALDRPLPTKDGGTLRTIGEACTYMTSMDKKRELRSHWQRACRLILAKEDVLAVSRALELALFMDAKLDVSKVPAE